MSSSLLVIACGALAREIVAVLRANCWNHITVQCLPADLHNRPQEIPGAVRARIQANKNQFAKIFVAYADCGTGGMLDRVIAQEGVERLPGAHCYQVFAGAREFDRLAEAQPATFYLTDFLAQHFQRLVVKGLGIDRHPQLKSMYFGNYERLVYLAQTDSAALDRAARDAACFLGLEFVRHGAGYGELETALVSFADARPGNGPGQGEHAGPQI